MEMAFFQMWRIRLMWMTPETGNKTLFVDADHDGDLDILVTRPTSNLLYRNNADGTFSEMAASMGLGITCHQLW